MIAQESIDTKAYRGIQSEKSQYRNSDSKNNRSGRNPRSVNFYESEKDDASGVYHIDEYKETVRDKFVLGYLQKCMQNI